MDVPEILSVASATMFLQLALKLETLLESNPDIMVRDLDQDGDSWGWTGILPLQEFSELAQSWNIIML